MRPLSAAELLDAWEQGWSAPASRRGVGLLTMACPEVSEVAELSIGERDWRLLTLREWIFGAQLVSVADCTSCGERLEWTATVADLRVGAQPVAPGELYVEVEPYRISFRLPNTLDLAAVAECPDAATARNVLLNECVIAAHLGDQEIAVEDLPSEVANAIGQKMSEADPQGDMRIDLTCPACGHRWEALFDIESFFWSEINAWAGRILGEVHVLASAYGWSEFDILNLAPQRRQFYLDLVGG